MKRFLPPTNDRGFLLVLILVGTLFITALSLSIATLVISNHKLAKLETYRVNSQMADDAAVSEAIIQINANGNWAGTGGEITLLQENNLKTTYSTTVSTSTATKKVIDITGRVYFSSSATPTTIRSIQITLTRGTAAASPSYAMMTGPGGLTLAGGTHINQGDVYVNGFISLSNLSKIGVNGGTTKVYVAHQTCPTTPNATYPRVCASGENGQPITIASNSKIYGQVFATNQTTTTGLLNPGLTPNSTAPVVELPSHDRAAITSASSSTITGASASCTSGATKVWPANVKITGNVTVNNACTVTVEGDIWVTGNLTVSNNSVLVVKNGLTSPPNIMIDGTTGFWGDNGANLTRNSGGIGFKVVTYAASAACNPGCTSVTGTNLYNSRSMITITIDKGMNATGSEFYARWSKVTIENGAYIGAVTGQTVSMDNGADVIIDSSVSNLTSTSTGKWTVESYRRTF